MIDSLKTCFEKIPDYRTGNGLKHKLIDILVLSVLGTLCGADGYTDIQEWGNSNEEWLKDILELPFGVPSHDVFGDVLGRLEPEGIHEAFMEWVAYLDTKISGRQIAIDGKTLCGSADKANGKKALHVVSAWARETSPCGCVD